MKILNNKLNTTNFTNQNQKKTSSEKISDKFITSDPSSLNLIPENLLTSSTRIEGKENWQKDQRPAKYLKTTEDGRIHMENVRCGFKEGKEDIDWEPIFKEVSVDPEKVKSVYLVIEPFAPEWIAGHALSYFEFEDDGPVTASDGKTAKGLVLSIEARLKEGESYNLIDGMKDKFLNVYQLGTWEDTIQKCSRRRGHKLIKYKLNFTEAEKKEFLKKSLEKAFQSHDKDYYNTLNNSCYSNQVGLINSILPKERRINEWIIPKLMRNPGTNIPNTAGFALGATGIINNEPPVKINPDKELFPDKQIKTSFTGEALKSVSGMRGWEFMSGLTGMAAGTAIGSLVLPPIVAIPTTGLLGAVVGWKTGEWIKRESHSIIEL